MLRFDFAESVELLQTVFIFIFFKQMVYIFTR